MAHRNEVYRVAHAGQHVLQLQVSCRDLPNTKEVDPNGKIERVRDIFRTQHMKEKVADSRKPDSYLRVGLKMNSNSPTQWIARTSVVIDDSNPAFGFVIELPLPFSARETSAVASRLHIEVHDWTSGSSCDQHKRIGECDIDLSLLMEKGETETSLEPAESGTVVVKSANAVSKGAGLVSMAAKELPRLDIGSGIDAFVHVEHSLEDGKAPREVIYTTETCESGRSPWWRRMQLSLLKLGEDKGMLYFTVYDQDDNSEDDFAGDASCSVKELLDMQKWDGDAELPLASSNNKGKGSTMVHQVMIDNASNAALIIQGVVVRNNTIAQNDEVGALAHYSDTSKSNS